MHVGDPAVAADHADDEAASLEADLAVETEGALELDWVDPVD